MKRTYLLLVLTISLISLGAACQSKTTTSGNSANVTQASVDTNRSKQPAASDANSAKGPSGATSQASSQAGERAQLIGSYEAREVEEKGVVTMISQIKTIFVFTADGTYQRVSQAKGKT